MALLGFEQGTRETVAYSDLAHTLLIADSSKVPPDSMKHDMSDLGRAEACG